MKKIILADFSKTFTLPSCPTTWSAFAKSGLLGEDYIADRDALFEANHHFELAGNIPETQRWFHEHAELFVKYKLSISQIENLVLDNRFFHPRDGIIELLSCIRENNIPLKIITSGITNFVETFFKARGFGVEGIELFGNTLNMENGVATSVDYSSGIIPLDKSKHPFDVTGYDMVYVIGDNKEDIAMYSGSNRKTIGFAEETIGFEYSLGKEGDFADAIKLIAE